MSGCKVLSTLGKIEFPMKWTHNRHSLKKRERENCKLFIKKKNVTELIDFLSIGRTYAPRGGILKIQSIGDLDGRG